MTREEEIKLAASCHIAASNEDFKEYYEGFIAGAKWADVTMMGKVCKWSESTDIDMEYWNSEDGVCKELLIEDIKKVMEGRL